MKSQAFRTMMWRAANRVSELLPATLSSGVLFYHSVDPERPASVRPEMLRAHLRRIRALGYRFVHLRDVPDLIGRGGSDLWVSITFDDGYANNAVHAAPIFVEEGAVATFAVVAGLVADFGRPARMSDEGHHLAPRRKMMTADQVRGVVDLGMEIASHSYSHLLMAELDPPTLERELVDSKARLEELSGRPVVSFTYPNGQRGAFSARTEQAVRAAGYRAAATTLWGMPSSRSNPLALPRCEVRSDATADDVEAIITGRRRYLWLLHRLRKGSELWNPSWMAPQE